MQKITSMLVLMLFLGAAMAGCTGEEVEKVVDTSDNEDTDNTGNTTNDTGDTTNDTGNTTNDSGDDDVTLYTSDQILAIMGADGSEDAALDFDSVGLNEPKFGVVMGIIGPGESIGLAEEDMGMPMTGDVTITMSNMYDDDAQLLFNGMSLTYGVDFGGSIMPITMQMSESNGPHPEIEGAGIINMIQTDESTMQPQGTWMTDHIWDYNAAKIKMGMAEEPCNGKGYMMESMGTMGPHCMCDDGYDWDDGDMMTCVGDDVSGGDDTGSHSFWCSDEVGGEPNTEINWALVNDGKEDCGDGADEPQDMDPSYDSDGDGNLTNDVDNWFTCMNGNYSIPMNKVNDGVIDCIDGDDEGMMGSGLEPICYDDDGNMIDCDDMMGDMLPELPEPSAEELLGATWTDSFDEITGIQSFTGVVNMEVVDDNMTITLTIEPSIPPKVTGLTMSNGTVTYTMSFLYGDDVVIDLISGETDGWEKGPSDFTLDYWIDDMTEEDPNDGPDECEPDEQDCNEEGCSRTCNQDGSWGNWGDDCTGCDDSDELDFITTTTLAGDVFGMIEVPSSQLELHMLSPGYQNDDTEEGEIFAIFTLENTPGDGSTYAGNWTDSNGYLWDVYWNCNNEQGLITESCGFSMSTTIDGDMSAYTGDFEIGLYDVWAEDYTGHAMPSFTLGLTIIALLGSCLLVQHRKTE